VPVWTDVTVSVVVAPKLSVSVVVTVTVVVVKPVSPLLAVTVYHPFDPGPFQPIPPHPTVPPHGPQFEQDWELVVQLEYAEHKADCKLEMVVYWVLGQAVETQFATAEVLEQ